MSKNANTAKAIKFYCQAPKIAQGQVSGYEVKATFMAVGQGQNNKIVTQLSYTLDTGASGVLEVTQTTDDNEQKTFIYKLADIIGRIEITG